jgi:hypothetical protein
MQLAKFTTVIGREVTWVYLQDNWTSIFAATNNLLMFHVTNQFSYSYPRYTDLNSINSIYKRLSWTGYPKNLSLVQIDIYG